MGDDLIYSVDTCHHMPFFLSFVNAAVVLYTFQTMCVALSLFAVSILNRV